MAAFSRILIAGLMLPLAGCIPVPGWHEMWMTARHKGVVLDAATRQPISNATITVVSSVPGKNIVSAKSGADGSFDVAPIIYHHVIYYIYSFPADGGCRDSIRVNAPGYLPENKETYNMGDPNGACTDQIYSHEILLKQQP